MIFKRRARHRFIWGGMIVFIGTVLYFVYAKYIIHQYSFLGPSWHARHLVVPIEQLIKKPWLIIKCWDLRKQEYFLSLFNCLGFIPLLSPMILLGLPILLQNLIISNVQATRHLWHTTLIIPFVFISFTYGIKTLLNIVKKYPYLKTLLVIFIIFPISFTGFLFYNEMFLQPFIEEECNLSYIPAEYKYYKRIKDWLSGEDSLYVCNIFLATLSNRKEIYWQYNYAEPKKIDTDFVFYNPKQLRYEEDEIFILPLLLKNYTILYNDHDLMFLGRNDIIKKDTIISFSPEDIYDFQYNLSNTKMEHYIDSNGALCVELFFDGDNCEDEYVQIKKDKLDLSFKRDSSKFLQLLLTFAVEDPELQTIEIVLGLDTNQDGNVDKYVKQITPQEIVGGMNEWHVPLDEILEDTYKSEEVSILDLEIYPHKLWNVDCSSQDKNKVYKFWLYGLEIIELYKKDNGDLVEK